MLKTCSKFGLWNFVGFLKYFAVRMENIKKMTTFANCIAKQPAMWNNSDKKL